MTNQLTVKQIQNNTCLLIEASNLGSIDIVKKLIPVSEPKTDNSIALRCAAFYGYKEIVQLLLPVSDPKVNDSEALQRAAEFGYLDIVKILIPVSDYQLVLKKNMDNTGKVLLRQCIDEYEALQQKELLNNTLLHIDANKSNNAKRKM